MSPSLFVLNGGGKMSDHTIKEDQIKETEKKSFFKKKVILELHKRGYSMSEIAARTYCDESVVRSIVNSEKK